MKLAMLRLIALPLSLLGILVSLYALWVIIGLPPEETITLAAKDFLARYGVATVLVATFLEGLLLIGWYFPGTLVVVVALIVAETGAQVAAIAAAAAAGLSGAYLVNFLVGKHGWYRLLLRFGFGSALERAQQRLVRYGLSAIFTTYWQTNLASLISTAAGVLQVPATSFAIASTAAAALWMGFWSITIALLGQAAMTLVGLRLALVLVSIWIGVRLILYARAHRRAARQAAVRSQPPTERREP